MLGKTHIAVGTTLATVTAATVGVEITPTFLIAASIGSLFPDIDHPKGMLNQKILPVHDGIMKSTMYGAIAFSIIYLGKGKIDFLMIGLLVPLLIAIAISKHRGIMHSLLCLLWCGLILLLTNKLYGINITIPFELGVISHILLDMFNPQGVELLWPLNKKIKFPLYINTGGIIENTLMFIFSISLGIFAYKEIDINSVINNLREYFMNII